MYLRANYKNIDDLSNYLIDKSDDIDDINENIKSLLNDLNNYWDGEDYIKFKNSYLTYINKSNVVSIELNAFGNALGKVGNAYSKTDTDFEEKITKMRKDDYEVR